MSYALPVTDFIDSFGGILWYLFRPNPGGVTYGHPAVITAFALSAALMVLALTLRSWRAAASNTVTKRISKTWSMTFFWFGAAGLVLSVARVEQIQFMAMRFLWVLWGLSLVLYLAFQVRRFRARHYVVLPSRRVDDPREKYLPGKKK